MNKNYILHKEECVNNTTTKIHEGDIVIISKERLPKSSTNEDQVWRITKNVNNYYFGVESLSIRNSFQEDNAFKNTYQKRVFYRSEIIGVINSIALTKFKKLYNIR